MKKTLKCLPIFIMLLMMLTFTGCSNVSRSVSEKSESNSSNKDKSSLPQSSNESISQMETKSLVVYFSWSKNTKQMAEWIADESGSDLYLVTPKESYGEDFDVCAERAKKELENETRPELTDLMDTQAMSQYDMIYVGFPIWWYDLPMVMTAFLEQYDLSGKTIVPFFSHKGNSTGASALETLTKVCTGATVVTDNFLPIAGSEVKNSEAQIRKWVSDVNK